MSDDYAVPAWHQDPDAPTPEPGDPAALAQGAPEPEIPPEP